MAISSETRTPVQVPLALQPSTHAIGRFAVDCGMAASSARVKRSRPDGPRTVNWKAGSRAAVTTPAAIAELLTGSPCGPKLGRRGAGNGTYCSGRAGWPTGANLIGPNLAPATGDKTRRV